jgi:hypothetical protein
MKTLQIFAVLAATLFAYSASALTIQVNSAVGGGFDRAVPGTFAGASLDGTEASSFDETIFQNASGANAGRSIYKVGHFNSSNANYWDDSVLAQTFSFTVTNTGGAFSGGANTTGTPRYRIYRSNPGSATQYYYKPWKTMVVGENTDSIGAQATNPRQVGIQIEGAGIAFTDFSHTYGTTTDSISVVSAVPEPSTYALLAGFAAFLFVAIKRRK